MELASADILSLELLGYRNSSQYLLILFVWKSPFGLGRSRRRRVSYYLVMVRYLHQRALDHSLLK
jgi:hypothetical protein